MSILQYLSITEYDKAITSLPMSYSYGLSVFNSHLLARTYNNCHEQITYQQGILEQFSMSMNVVLLPECRIITRC